MKETPPTQAQLPSLPEDVERSASYMAEQLCNGFIHHDQRRREASIKAFGAVDALQFPDLDETEAVRAALGYVDALWVKDEIEESCRVNGSLDPERLEAADWSPMEDAFERRAEVADIDPRYAELTTTAWINHKTGEDYWSPMMQAQMLELRAALGNPAYPEKPRHGQDGFGPEPTRYALGVELHDMRRWDEARDAMTPYFQYILDEQE
ncbi:hypothetical protein EI982_08070 [Haloplanus rallus]|uniref:Uncharacterized protein n=1 Tax=Haloplanus rallus TaxID=1816183 RepID=A0A6B9F2Z7_9EURY|nr:hypothetical protein [Haloplanus rallus]QGX94755.1 hypothetical protein EI982_08070 [Haloplanus rallus]